MGYDLDVWHFEFLPQVIGYALWIYIILILARVVIEWTRQFARSWRPVGTAAVSLELVYVATDPPIRHARV